MDDNTGHAVPPLPAQCILTALETLPGSLQSWPGFGLIPRVPLGSQSLPSRYLPSTVLGLDEKGLPRRSFWSSWAGKTTALNEVKQQSGIEMTAVPEAIVAFSGAEQPAMGQTQLLCRH